MQKMRMCHMDGIERFCDDGAFRERGKPRRVVRNLYDGQDGPKIGRYHIFFHNNNYCTRIGDSQVVLKRLTGKRAGSYSIR